MRRIGVPKSLLKVPANFRVPKVSDFESDMQRIGEELAKGFKRKLLENIESNAYGFTLAQSTIRQKGSSTPLIDTETLLNSIYREDTYVTVEDTPRTDSPLTNLELAIVLEYGTKDKGIPARPVWRYTFRDYREVAELYIRDFLRTHKFKSLE